MKIRILKNGFDIMENLAYSNRKTAAREQGEYLIVLAAKFYKCGVLSSYECFEFVDRIENILDSCGCPVLKNYEVSKNGELVGYYRMSDTDKKFYENSPFNHSEIKEAA